MAERKRWEGKGEGYHSDPANKYHLGGHRLAKLDCPECNVPLEMGTLVEEGRPIAYCPVCLAFSFVSDIVAAGEDGLESFKKKKGGG